MILAAGLGTRLRPLTEETPKALVEVGGVPMLERVARRLVAAGADRLVVNVHPFADRIERFLADLGLGVDLRVSREPDGPLGTGGGIARAAPLFRRDDPFFVHNVDIVTDADLEALYRAHLGSGAIVTLAVGRRETTRHLLFDEIGLYGWENTATGASETGRPAAGETTRWPFAGISVTAPRFLDRIEETGAFSVIRTWLRLSGEGERIVPWDLGGARWLEVGTPDRLAGARDVFERQA